MDDVQRYRDEDLPVTAEVGGEGGSFAEPTYQKSDERPDGLERASDTRQPDAAADTAQYAEHREQVANGGVGTAPDPAHGMKSTRRSDTSPPRCARVTLSLRRRATLPACVAPRRPY